MEILCNFRFILGGNTCKEIPESSRLGIFEKFLVNNFTLSSPMNRRGIADFPLLKTLLAIH